MTPSAIPVLLTAVGSGGNGEQLLKAMRLAEPGRYRLYGADANPWCPQAEWVERFFVLPRANDPGYLDALFDACDQVGARAVIHGSEPELLVHARNREAFEERGILLPINPTSLIELCMDKTAANARLAELGFQPPRYVQARTRADLDAIDWFPVVVKPSTGGSGSASVYLAQNARELRALAEFVDLSEGDREFIVQEYVGTPDSEYTVGILHALDGTYVNAIALRRHLRSGLSVRLRSPNRTDRQELGASLVISSGVSQGDLGRFEEVLGPCREIAAALGARGPMNIQCRLDQTGVRVFEINPRFSGTSSLRAMVGLNEPDLLLGHHLLGEPLPVDAPYRERTILRSLVEEFAPEEVAGS